MDSGNGTGRMDMENNTFTKAERLCSRKAIETLFAGGAQALTAFPLRAVFRQVDEGAEVPVSVLVSVSKKRFKRAVKRNRVKRQIREAYRKNKHPLTALLAERGAGLHLAIIYLNNELYASPRIESRMAELLERIGKKVGGTA